MLNNGLLKNNSFDDDNMSLVDDIDETSVNENLTTNLKETFKNNEYDYNFDKNNEELDNLKDTEMEINDLKLTYTNKGNKEETKIENISFEKQILPKDDSQKEKLLISSIGIVESYNNDQTLIIKDSINKEESKTQNENTAKDEFKDKIIFGKKKIYSNEKIDINCEKIILTEKNKNEIKVDININKNSTINSLTINTATKNDITPSHNSNKYGLLMKSINQNEKSTNNDNPHDQNYISTKLNQTEKEYFNLKRIFSENMLIDGSKLNNLEGEKLTEYLNRQNNELKKFHEKFSQIDLIMKSIEYLEGNNKPKQIKNQAIEKILDTSVKQHNFLTLRLSVLTSENYESSLDTVLLETVKEINHFEIQNRVSRHSKKKSEIKFNKTQKVSNSIDSKKINNDYNVSKQQSDNLNIKINKNKRCIEENEAKINNFKEDLSKLKEIAEFYGITELDMKYLFVNSIIDLNNPNDVNFITSKKSELIKKYEGLNKRKDANLGNFEINKQQNMNYIKDLDNKKHDIMILIKEKMIKAEAENEKVKELYYLKQNCKIKNICEKNSEIVRICKKDKLDTIDERENEDLCRNNKNVEIKESDNFAEIIIESDNIIEKKVEKKSENNDENDNKNELLDTNLKDNFVYAAQNVKNEENLIKNEENQTNSNELQSAAQEEINKIKREDQVTDVITEKCEKLNVEIEINEKNDEIPEIKTNRDIIEFENKTEVFEKQANSPKNIRTNLYLADKSQEDKENTLIIKENIQFKSTKIQVDQKANEDNLTKINPVEIQNKYKRDSVNKENSDKKNVEKKEDALLFIKDYNPKYAEETILNLKENKKETLNTNSSAQVKNKKIESKKKNPTNFEQKSLFSDVFNDDEDNLITTPIENKQINQKRKNFDQLFQSDITTETIKISSKNLNNHTSQRNEKPAKLKTKTIDDLDDLIL